MALAHLKGGNPIFADAKSGTVPWRNACTTSDYFPTPVFLAFNTGSAGKGSFTALPVSAAL